MTRNAELFKSSLQLHYTWQFNYFTTIQNNLYEKAKKWIKRGFPDKADRVKAEADKMRFEFDKSTSMIHFGDCSKLNKSISFIPNICQLTTQQCFKHRKL